MFFENQIETNQRQYENFLKIVGSLSNLFSDSSIPYLYYRIAEKIFCRAFEAEDLSRSDVSADAKKWRLGIGLKTFLIGNKKTFQKVAEFNSDRTLYADLDDYHLVKKIAELRNERIAVTQNIHALDNSIYHCIVRDQWMFKIFEESMDPIDLENIHNIKKSSWSIAFSDGIHDYSFLISKSTLTKRFCTNSFIYTVEVPILKDPLVELEELLSLKDLWLGHSRIQSTIYLPLYWSNQEVKEKSGLNQWNAWGRARHPNEVYIPIPRLIHKLFPTFFPPRDCHFDLILPNWKIMKSKVCQDGSKALMSYSNRELGKWILRDILHLKEWELLTYAKLQSIGIDSVRIDKLDDFLFEINFSHIWAYEKFIESMV